MPSPAPPFVHNTRLSADDLTQAARTAWEGCGLTQAKAAERLGVSRVTFAHAIGEPGRSLTSLRTRIVEEFTDFRVEGPEYRIVRKDAGATGSAADAAAPDGEAGEGAEGNAPGGA